MAQTAASPLEGTGIPSPAPTASFLALEDDGRKTFPSTYGAVGSNYLMVTLNSQVRIQDRVGTPISTVTLENWWSSLGCSNVTSPRVLFDPYAKRWIFSAIGDRGVLFGLLLAVSQTSDPNGNWNRYFNSLSNSLSHAPLYGDSPNVGFNTNRIVVQINTFDTNFQFFGWNIYAFNKTNLYGGGAGLNKLFPYQDLTGDVTEDMAPVPAVTFSPTLTTNFLVANDIGNYTDGIADYGAIRIYSITGPLGGEVLNTTDLNGDPGPFAIIDTPWEITAPDDIDFLPQAGLTNLIYAGDARITSVVWRNSTLWASHTVFLPPNTPDHAAVQWWEITPVTGGVFQSGRIEDPSGALHYAYPSLSVNVNDDALIGYSQFSASQYPSANYSMHIDADGAGTSRDSVIFKSGEGPYYSLDSQFQLNVWGDTSATMVDPNNDSDLWTIQEYGATNNTWGTWWARLSPPVDLALTMVESPDPVFVTSNLTFTLVVTNFANRLTIAGGVTVTNPLPSSVNFVSASTAQGSWTLDNGVLKWSVGDLPPQGQATLTLVVTPTIVGPLTNRATVFGNGQDANFANNTAVTTTTVVNSADLAVFVFDAPDPVTLSSNLTYTVVVTNQGPATASAVALTNTLPSTVTFLSASSTQGTNTRSGNVITFNFGALASGASASASIVVSCPTAGLITDRATVAATTPPDPGTNNNTAVITTKVNSPPAIQTILNRAINEDVGDAFSFGVSDPETPSASLLVTASSSNPALIPNANLALGGSGGTRTLTITPLPNQSGSASITLTVTDADGGFSKTTWTETVNSVNDAPTLDPINPVLIDEDSGPRTVNLTGISTGAANEADTLTINATSSNPAILPNPGVSYVNGNTTGTLTLTPVLNTFGTVTVTVTVSDGQAVNPTVTRQFTVTVSPVNDPPTLNPISGVTINEDATQQTVSLSGITSGAANEADVLSLSASSDNPALIPNPTPAYTSPFTTGALTFTPVANQFGTANITVTVSDGRPTNNTVTRTFTVTVNPVNDPPTLGTIGNVTINEDAPQQNVSLTGISPGAPNELDTLTVTATSSNPSLIPSPLGVTYHSPDSTGTLMFTPVPTKSGTATITVTVNDGRPTNNIATRTFSITVNSVNDPPTLDAINGRTIDEDSGTQTITLTGISPGATNEFDALVVTATSANTALIPNPTVAYTSPNPTGTLTFTPVANGYGTALIRVVVSDGQLVNGAITNTFTVTVNSVNDAPTLNQISNLVINEDAGLQTVSLGGISSGAPNEPDSLTVSAISSNPGIVPHPTAAYTNPNSTGSLSFTPVANAFGTVTVTVTVDDGQSANNTVSRTFTVTVNPVNDPPTLNALPNLTLNEDAGTQNINLTGISSGAPNESDSLTMTVTSSNPSLIPTPTVLYQSPNPTGTLLLSPVANASGITVIKVVISDGQPANNSVTNSFQVTVNPINDLPTISVIEDQTMNEDVPLTIPFTIGDVETPAANLVLSAQISNGELFSPAGITFGGSGANRTVTVRNLTNEYGSGSITVWVIDANGGSNVTFFAVDVLPVNDPPYISTIPNQVTGQDVPVTVSFTIDDPETSPDQLDVSATSSVQAVVPDGNLLLGGSGGSRTLRLTPAPGASGTTIITIGVDDGQTFTTRMFSLNVNALPTITSIPDQTIAEDNSTPALSFVVGDAETPATSLLLSGTSSNPSLVASAGITFGGAGSSRTVTVRPVTNQFGLTIITVTVTDSSGNTGNTSFRLLVNSINDPPAISGIGNQTINEDTSTLPIAFTISDPEAPVSALTLSVASSNPGLVPNSNIQLSGSGSARSVIVVPSPNQSGSATLTLTVRDPEGLTASSSFVLTVNPVNDPPTLSNFPDQTTSEDTPLSLPFAVGDVDTPLSSLIPTASSSNPGLVPLANIIFVGSGANRSVTITPAANQSGTTTITINLSDGAVTTSAAFNLTVLPVNDLPTLSAIANQTINEDTSSAALAFTVGDLETTPASLFASGSSSNPTLVPNGNLIFGGSGASRTLTISPAPNQFGTATISYSVTDANGGSVTNSFLLTVNPINDAPTISAIPNQVISEDSSISVPFTVGDVDTPLYALTITASSSNPTLIPVANILPDGYGASRLVTITPAANQSGSSTISLAVSDGVTSTSTSFVLTVNPVNDLPTLNPVPNLFTNINPGTVTIALAGISSGAANETQVLAVSATNNNPALFQTQPTANYTSPNSTGTLTFKPLNSAVGSGVITVTVSDGTNTFSQSFTLSLRASANVPPTITGIASQTISEDASTAALPFTVNDATTPANLLTVTGRSSNQNLIPNGNIVVVGTDNSRTVTVTPALNQSGTATITLSVTDTNYGGANMSFSVTVNALNDSPVISPIPDQVINEDTPSGAIPFRVGDAETAAASLTVSAVSGNTTLVPNANIALGGTGTNRALNITPALNQSGVSTITVTVSDGVSTANASFLLTVNPVNDAPAISAIANQTIAEDTPTSSLAFSVGDLETAPASLSVSGTSSNPALVPNGNIAVGGSGASRSVIITPAPDQNGLATITLTVSDGTTSSSSSFLLTVTPVNDPPTLNALANLTVTQGASQQTIALSGITAGPNEVQTLAVSALSSNPGLIPNPVVNYFSPNTTGSLSFTPVATNGSATITVTVNDGQSLNNLAIRTFTVLVTNSAPPSLSISASGENVVISWPADTADYVLQTRDTLSAAWTPVGTPPFLSGNRLSVTQPASGSSRFYRLAKNSGPSSVDSVPLGIKLSGGKLSLFWPGSSAALLESTDDLGSDNWQPVKQPPVQVNSQNTVTLTPSAARIFFRLHSP